MGTVVLGADRYGAAPSSKQKSWLRGWRAGRCGQRGFVDEIQESWEQSEERKWWVNESVEVRPEAMVDRVTMT